MNIEEIMKPYFDKKEELEKKQEINNKYLEERNMLNLRLERLRDNKDREIEEYVQNAVADRPDFYAGYGAMIRKDLEQAYVAKEQELQNQIRELNEKMEINSKELSRYHRVDIRELVDIKHELRKSLMSAKKELEIKLQEANLRFEAVMFKLSTFKYEYDENHNVLNGNEYRELFEESNSLIDVKYNLQRNLKQIDEYLNITELTEEEVNTVMMSMSDLEKEEYNRRKVVSTIEPVFIKFIEEIREQYPDLYKSYDERLNNIIAFNPELKSKIAELSLSQTNFADRLEQIYIQYPNVGKVLLEFFEEYNNRKAADEKNKMEVAESVVEENISVEEEQVVDLEEQVVEPEEPFVEENISEEEEQVVAEDNIPEELNNDESTLDEDENLIYEQANEAIEKKLEMEENYTEFMKEVTVDVLNFAKKLRTINIENGKYISTTNPARGEDGNPEVEQYDFIGASKEMPELPNGVYFNLRDIEKALNNYVKQNKGRNFTVKGIDLTLNVTKSSVRKVKKMLKKCSANKLLLEKKLSTFDIKRVYGKEKAEDYIKVDSKTHMPSGQYVLLTDVYEAFKELFVEKTPTWKERFFSKFRKNEVQEINEIQDAEYEQVELEDEEVKTR